MPGGDTGGPDPGWRRRVILAVVVCSILAAVGLSRLQIDDDLRSLLRNGSDDFVVVDEIAERFGAPDRDCIVRVSATTDSLFTPATLEHLRDLVDDLASIDEIGPVIAATVHEWLASDHGQAVVGGLAEAGVSLAAPQGTAAAADGPLVGKTLVVTGTLERYSRDEAEAAIRAAGGRASSSVSKKTDWLVAGSDAGSKLEKARKLGVAIVDEPAFTRLLAGEPPGA